MPRDNRIRLSASEAAAYRKESVSTLYRRTLSDPLFPKPHKSKDKHKSNGKLRSFWYKDELDTYAEKHEPTRALRQQYLDLARRCVDSELNPYAPNPAVHAYLLAGGDLRTLAMETDVPEEMLHAWTKCSGNIELTDDLLRAIFTQAVARVLYQEKVLRGQLHTDPAIADRADFRKLLRDLDQAHTLCFGRSLLDHLIMEGRRHGNA